MAQFQAAKAEAPDTLELMESINIAQGDGALTPASIKSAFEMWWPKLQSQLNEIEQESASITKPKNRSEIELLEEILDIVRQLNRNTTATPFTSGQSAVSSGGISPYYMASDNEVLIDALAQANFLSGSSSAPAQPKSEEELKRTAQILEGVRKRIGEALERQAKSERDKKDK